MMHRLATVHNVTDRRQTDATLYHKRELVRSAKKLCRIARVNITRD